MENKMVPSQSVISASGKSQRSNLTLSHQKQATKPLTREMLAAKCKTDNLSMIKNVNLWGNEIDNLNLLREMPNLEIVSLSLNKVVQLRDFSYCHKIQEIYLRKNLISDLQEVQHLASLPKLRLLMLSHNPCANHPYYRPFVVHKLPALSRLDNADVKIEERAAANRLNFDQIFKDSPSNVSQDSANASSKQKRPSTPTVFQPNNVSNQQQRNVANNQYSSQPNGIGSSNHNQSVMSEQHQSNIRHSSKSPLRRPESSRLQQQQQQIAQQQSVHHAGGRKTSIHSSSQVSGIGQAQSQMTHNQSVSESQLNRAQPGFVLGQGANAQSSSGVNERNENILRAVLALTKELTPTELELVRRDIDKKVVTLRQQNSHNGRAL